MENHVAKVQATLSGLSAEQGDAEIRKGELEVQLRLIQDRRGVVQSELQQYEAELQGIKTRMETEVEAIRRDNNLTIMKSNEEKQIALSELETCLASLANTRERIVGLDSRANELSATIETLTASIGEKQNELSALVQSTQLLKDEKAELTNKLNKETQDIIDANTALKNEGIALKNQNDEAKAEFQRIQQETFALVGVKEKLDAREKQIDINEAKIRRVYEEAQVPYPN